VPDACLFCQPDDPGLNTVLAANATCYARYDNYPVAPGHIEVVPLRHVESLFDLTPAEVADAWALLLTVRGAIAIVHRPDGYTIGVNEGAAAGRTIDHAHIHLIPRHLGDVPDPRGGHRGVGEGIGMGSVGALRDAHHAALLRRLVLHDGHALFSQGFQSPLVEVHANEDGDALPTGGQDGRLVVVAGLLDRVGERVAHVGDPLLVLLLRRGHVGSVPDDHDVHERDGRYDVHEIEPPADRKEQPP
jgi:diadenosine tetraphosphate (Ap4A) HIT family hydrolase